MVWPLQAPVLRSPPSHAFAQPAIAALAAGVLAPIATIVLVIVIMFRPKGIFGTYELSLRNFFSDMKRQRQNRLAQKQESKEALSHE